MGGGDYNPVELKRWSIGEEEDAKKELGKYLCEYHSSVELTYIEEYALEYCECDEEGDFLSGSDYFLAEEKIEEN